ncbi:MAG: leucine-rich repeat domain-containing protein, partial [Bacteroidaceae bacterium]
LTSITLPNSVTSIGDKAFSGCTGLKELDINMKDIGSWFQSCTSIVKVILGQNVTSIGDKAFKDCSGLTSITLPNSVTSIGDKAFYGCNLNLILYGSLSSYGCFYSLATTSVIYAPYREIERIKSYFSGNVRPLDPYVADLIRSSLCQISFKIKENEGSPIKGTLLSVKMGNTVLSPDESGVYTVKGLAPSTSYGITVSYKTEDGDIREYSDRFTTKTPTIEASCHKTLTTLTVSVSASSDESCSPTDLSFTCNDKTYTYTGSPVTITGLHPNTTYWIEPYAYYGTKKVSGWDREYTTSSLNPQVTVNISPNGITAIGSFTKGDAIVTETGFTNYSTGNVLTLTGLEPSSEYAITYYVKTEDGGREECTRNFTTTNLELTTLQPKSVSNSCAIVAAATNLSEEETNAGFQWIKYDAPASLKPSEGYAAIYGNQLEGYIKNIQSTSYYKVRAFYKSAAGEYYYGKWITFDPSDFSYFEPTVHTYPVQEVSHNTVKLKGYVMAGTDNITEQGFQYWVSGTSKSSKMYARATDATSEVSTVLATGQVMTASLESLQPNTTYKYRAFVKTASSTKFGEEQTFTTTNDLTGVDDVKVEETELTVVGYYDINGRKLNTMKSGINLIRYSDGTVRKVMVK